MSHMEPCATRRRPGAASCKSVRRSSSVMDSMGKGRNLPLMNHRYLDRKPGTGSLGPEAWDRKRWTLYRHCSASQNEKPHWTNIPGRQLSVVAGTASVSVIFMPASAIRQPFFRPSTANVTGHGTEMHAAILPTTLRLPGYYAEAMTAKIVAQWLKALCIQVSVDGRLSATVSPSRGMALSSIFSDATCVFDRSAIAIKRRILRSMLTRSCPECHATPWAAGRG